MSSHEHQTYIGHELAQYRKKQHCGSLVATELMSGISTFRRTRYGHLGAETTDYFLVSTWHISRIHNSKYVGWQSWIKVENKCWYLNLAVGEIAAYEGLQYYKLFVYLLKSYIYI
jgi:hypothetical protein